MSCFLNTKTFIGYQNVRFYQGQKLTFVMFLPMFLSIKNQLTKYNFFCILKKILFYDTNKCNIFFSLIH